MNIRGDKINDYDFFLNRLVDELNEEGELELRVYYTLDNSLEYRGKDPQFLILPPECRPVVLGLFTAYPRLVSVNELIEGRVKDQDREVGVTERCTIHTSFT